MKKLILLLLIVCNVNAGDHKPTIHDKNFMIICNGFMKNKPLEQILTTRSIQDSYIYMSGMVVGALYIAGEYPSILNRDRFKNNKELMKPLCTVTIGIHEEFEKENGQTLSFTATYKAGLSFALKKKK